jgi:hypothetical protein
MVVEGGGDLLTLKRHGGWKSSSVAEGYMEDSIARKVDISKKIFKNVNMPSHTTTSNSMSLHPETEVNDAQMENENNPNHFFTIDDFF